MLYTAKGTAALLVPFSSVITAATGDWHAVFVLASAMAGLTALIALFVLKPMREAHARKHVHANTTSPMGYRTVPEDLT